MILMFIGRIGPLTLMVGFEQLQSQEADALQYGRHHYRIGETYGKSDHWNSGIRDFWTECLKNPAGRDMWISLLTSKLSRSTSMNP